VTCRAVPSPLDELIALWNYESPVDAVIRGLKFSRLPQLAIPLGLELAERLLRRELVVDLVATVPLHWRRRLVRGYDQSEEIARTVAARLGVSLGRPLRRCRATAPQSSLPRNRRTANLVSAFRARRPNRLSAAHVLLVDDVVTSGATLRAAASRLKRLGVQKVTAAAIARTPAPGEVACPGDP
jgi:ComF family protein